MIKDVIIESGMGKPPTITIVSDHDLENAKLYNELRLEKNLPDYGVYIAGPMSPDSKREMHYKYFNGAARQLREAGYNVLNPAELRDPSTTSDRNWVKYMREDIVIIARRAIGVCLLEGWDKSRGASLEYAVANGLGLPCHGLDWWLHENPARPEAILGTEQFQKTADERLAASHRAQIEGMREIG